jgi:hypothetical protein
LLASVVTVLLVSVVIVFKKTTVRIKGSSEKILELLPWWTNADQQA